MTRLLTVEEAAARLHVKIGIGGSVWVYETTLRIYDDWRDTPLGPVNLGRSWLETTWTYERRNHDRT